MGLAGAARRRAIAQSCVYYFWYLALGATISSLGALLPGIGRQTGATLEQQKYLVPPRATGFGLGSVLGGWLLERADGHRIMAAAAAATTAVNLVMAGASSFSIVLAMQLCYGLLGGCSEVVINTLTIQVWGEDVGPYMQFLHACFAIGAAALPQTPTPPTLATLPAGTVFGPLVVAVVLQLSDGVVAPAFIVFAAFTFPTWCEILTEI